MPKSIFFFLLLMFSVTAIYSQQKGLSKSEKKSLDSMLQQDDFFNMIKERDRSYFDVNVGIGNGVFSINNNSFNAGQSETDIIFYSPSVGYYHKTGLALSVSGFLTTDKGSLKMYQYAINPSYTYDSKSVTASISYTRFIKGSSASFDVSPFQNDFYATGTYKKTWIQPGIAAGYSSGRIIEKYDTSFWFTPQPPFPPVPRIVHITDTITTKLRSFSLSAFATHQWEFDRLLSKKDALTIQPTLMLNAGTQQWNIVHSNSINNRRPFIQNQLKNRYGNGSSSEPFTIQSIAFLAELSYYFGKFYLQPQLYLDYYLPSTTSKRLTTLFSVVAGISF